MLFSIHPYFTSHPSPHSYTQKGGPYPTYLPPGQDSQHEVCRHPLHHSYAGSTRIVQHSGNKMTPTPVIPWKTHDWEEMHACHYMKAFHVGWGQGMHKMAQSGTSRHLFIHTCICPLLRAYSASGPEDAETNHVHFCSKEFTIFWNRQI